MIIGVDASRAFQKNRTGIEEYSYQVIKHLMDKSEGHQVLLYIKKSQKSKIKSQNCRSKAKNTSSRMDIDILEIPDNWTIKTIGLPYLWTQIGLSLELLLHPVDALFVPAHIVPIIHPRKTIVTVHGLEYEFYPKSYSFWARMYMRWAIKRSCRVANKIIAVSKNTKKDLVKLYKVPSEKIEVVYEGVNQNFESNYDDKISKPYLLFVGRLEERKNICGIIEAYKILREKYDIPHSLVLAGSPGFGYELIKLKIKNYLQNYKIKNLKIIELGYINEAMKWQLLSNADIFLFPTYYEGFGLPILEAQSVGTPVVASDNSSIPEVTDDSAVLINPKNPSEIAEAAYNLVSDETLRNAIIAKGHKNIERFNWGKCAEEIAKILSI